MAASQLQYSYWPDGGDTQDRKQVHSSIELIEVTPSK